MNNNLIDFTKAIITKKTRKFNQDSEDILQDVLIEYFEKGISEVNNNEIQLCKIIQYHINKNRQSNNKSMTYSNDYLFENMVDEPEDIIEYDTDKLLNLLQEFKELNPDIKEENFENFYLIKFKKYRYKELDIDHPTQRKTISNIYIAFKKFLFESNYTLDDFIFVDEKEF